MTNQNDTNTPSTDPKEQPAPQTPVAPTASQKGQMSEKGTATPNDEKNVSKELAREFRWVEFSQIASNLVLAVVGIIALCIYNGQLKEMRRSTKVTEVAAMAAKSAAETAIQQTAILRQQLVGEQEAVVRMTPQFSTNIIEVPLGNIGKVNASHVHLVGRGCVVSLPTTKEVKCERFSFIDETIQPNRPEIGHEIIVPALQNEVDLFKDTKRGFKIEGELAYDNGFSDTRQENFCLIRVHWIFKSLDLQEKLSSTPREDTWQCDEVPSRLVEAVRSNKELEQRKH